MRINNIVSDCRLKTIIVAVMSMITGFITIPPSTNGLDMGDSVLRDYPISLVLPHKRVELSLDHIRIDDAIDIFDIREEEVPKAKSEWHETVGDMQGFRGTVNIGVLEGSNLHTEYTYRKIDYGVSNLAVNSYEISWKQHLPADTYGGAVFFAIDGGIRYNFSDDQEFTEESQINAALNRFVDRVEIQLDQDHVRFQKTTDSGIQTETVDRNGKPEPKVINSDMYDYSPFIRFTAGRIVGPLFPNLFVEYGSTKISSSLDFSMKDDIPSSVADRFPDLPIDLNRHEDYIRTGLCILWKNPYLFMARLEYNYLKLFRESGIGYVDDNHIIKADINYFITTSLILNFGGVYFHRQYNGIIPFMYNEYTQSTFDHRYGRVHLGMTYLLNW